MSDLKMPDELPACNVCKEPDCKRIPAIVAFHRSGKALTEQLALSRETDACYARKDAAEKAKDALIANLESRLSAALEANAKQAADLEAADGVVTGMFESAALLHDAGFFVLPDSALEDETNPGDVLLAAVKAALAHIATLAGAVTLATDMLAKQAAESRWVACSERLPPDDVSILVWVTPLGRPPERTHSFFARDCHYKGQWESYADGRYRISAWREIAPPEVK